MNKKIIHTVFEHIAATYPNHIAAKEEHQQITYEALNNLANELSHILKQLVIDKGAILATMMPSGIQLVGSLLAIFKAGGIYLPLNSNAPKKKLKNILDQCQPQVFIIPAKAYNEVVNLFTKANFSWKYIMCLDAKNNPKVFVNNSGVAEEITFAETLFDNPPILNEPEDGNYIFYTSGSTGDPKAILGQHKSLGHFIDWEIKQFEIDHTSRVSQLSQITFDASLRDIFVPLCTGGTLYIPTEEIRSNTLKLLSWIEDNKISIIHTVPSVLRMLNKMLGSERLTDKRFKSLKYLMLSGEALYEKDIASWRAYAGDHCTVVNLYGTTETTMIRTYHVIGEVQPNSSRRIPVGKPMSHTLIALVNDNIECKVGEIGEIYIKSPFFTKGYLFDPVLNQKVFVQNPLSDNERDIVYKTGDLGRLLDNGNLEVLGRADSQVKVNGVRIELNEIEKAMLSISGVEEAVVLLHTDKDFESALVCYYTGKEMETDQIQTLLAEHLEPTAIPKWIKYMESLPLNMNGKVDRKSLANTELFLNVQEYKAPVGDIETQLEEIWKDVLKLSRVSRDVSFFSIGGTSLKAIQTISRIYKQFDILLKIGDLFDHPTIMALAKMMESAKKKEYYNIVPISPQEYYEVTYAQKRLWILNQTEEGQVAYNMPCAYKIKGELNVDVFQEALRTIIARHEILRTTFVNSNGEPMQKIHEEGAFDHAINLIDIRKEEQQEAYIHRIAEEDWNKPFDLENGPLLRTILLVLNHHEFVLLFNMHHIISDGWTLDLLSYEVFSVYEGLLQKSSFELPPLKIQYKDYAHWEKQQLTGNRLREHREFWLNNLEGELPVLEIQNTGPRPEAYSYNGGLVEFTVDKDLTSQLNRMAKENQATIFMVLLALTKVLLYRFSGQNDIIVGVPNANREHKDLENQAGFYVNTMAVRSRFDAKMTFTELLEKIKANMVNVYEHSIYPIDLLVEDLKLDYDASRNSLFDVMVQIQDTKASLKHAGAIDNFEIEKLNIRPTSSKFDFTFNYFINNEQLLVGIEFNSDLYDSQLVNDMKEGLLTLVRKLVISSTSTISELRNLLLTSEDIKKLEEQQKVVSSEISNDY
jgi:mycobactin peptide synthetase MbtE